MPIRMKWYGHAKLTVWACLFELNRMWLNGGAESAETMSRSFLVVASDAQNGFSRKEGMDLGITTYLLRDSNLP